MSAQPARSVLHLVAERPPGPGLSDFALWLRANGCGDNTIADRLRHVGGFAREHESFPHVRPMHVTAWLGREGYTKWSRATFYGHLRSYFTFALENDLIAVDPMSRMKYPGAGKTIPRPLEAEQVEQLLTAAKDQRNLHAWLTLALYGGLRSHEIAKIKGEHVDQRNIFVLGKGGTEAYIPTHPRVWVLAQTRPRVGYWFPSHAAKGHVTSMSVSTMTTRLFKSCGLEGSIHRCRHTYATDLLRAGVNVRVVQELLRHRSLSSTMIYTAVSEEEMRDGISRLRT